MIIRHLKSLLGHSLGFKGPMPMQIHEDILRSKTIQISDISADIPSRAPLLGTPVQLLVNANM